MTPRELDSASLSGRGRNEHPPLVWTDYRHWVGGRACGQFAGGATGHRRTEYPNRIRPGISDSTISDAIRRPSGQFAIWIGKRTGSTLHHERFEQALHWHHWESRKQRQRDNDL